MSFIFIILLVLFYLVISIFILRVQMFQDFLYFVFLGDFEFSHMVVLSHVLEDASHNHNAVLVIANLKVNLCRLGNFLYKKGTCDCQNEGEAKIRIELFFFKSCF
jgi:hypothetical protein